MAGLCTECGPESEFRSEQVITSVAVLGADENGNIGRVTVTWTGQQAKVAEQSRLIRVGVRRHHRGAA
jgi:hypothetical protein